MRLASFNAAGSDRMGFELTDGRLVDLTAAMLRQGMGTHLAPRTVLELIEAGNAMWARARNTAEQVARDPRAYESYAPAMVNWHAPVRRPSKICCLALNNSANRDRILQGPDHPAMFIKPSSALVGHGASIECKPQYGRTHPEPELAVVIGRIAKNVRPEDAYQYVFGYTIHNDITSPTMRSEDTFHYRAIHPHGSDRAQVEYVDTWVSYPGRYKCSDTFACMGPCVVTQDEIPDPHDLAVSCLHQGRLVTQDSTANLTHKLPQVLAFLSSYLTLLPGDILSLGTALKASGEGGAVQNVDLNKLGGPVSVVIERIGTLTNPVAYVT
jgi:2-keto-4-pentenoate hydratase/2-oxohepta-3-ene-1,7-dioic acid hydratase in catechol pathway